MARTKKVDEASVPFEDLLSFVTAKESESVRILKILTTDEGPEAVRLAYSFPLVEKTDKDGFETVEGEFVAYA